MLLLNVFDCKLDNIRSEILVSRVPAHLHSGRVEDDIADQRRSTIVILVHIEGAAAHGDAKSRIVRSVALLF